MRFVIFDDETMEPITVVNLPGIAERDILERMGGIVRMAIIPKFEFKVREADNPPAPAKMDVVVLRFERFVRRNQVSLMCFTREAELAMLLDPDFLPGQRGCVRDLQRQNDRLAELVLKAISKSE